MALMTAAMTRRFSGVESRPFGERMGNVSINGRFSYLQFLFCVCCLKLANVLGDLWKRKLQQIIDHESASVRKPQ